MEVIARNPYTHAYAAHKIASSHQQRLLVSNFLL